MSSSILDMPSDVESLRKHLGMVLDRLSKGVKLVRNSGKPAGPVAEPKDKLTESRDSAKL